jgi:hypothetical protein
VLRLRPDRVRATFGLAVLLTATALSCGTFAQPAPDTTDRGLFDPPGGQGVVNPDGSDEPPSLILKSTPMFGNPPGQSAGKSGFDSTNARRKIQTQEAKKKERRPLAPVVTTQATPARRVVAAPASPPTRPADPGTTASVGPPYAPPYAPPVRAKSKPPQIDPYEPLGIRAGAFIVKPALEVSGGHDSNPGRDAEKPKGSPFYVLAPELQAISDWERHEFRAKLRGNYTGYTERSMLNLPFFESLLDGRIDVTRQTRIELQNRFRYSADMPGSPNFKADVAKLTPFTNVGGTAALFHRFNRLEIGGKVTIDRTRYDDSELTDGSTASNEDRAFYAYGLELRGSYEMTPGIKPFVSVTGDKRTYDLERDSFGISRDSTALTPRLGTSFELTRLLTGEASIGYVQRNYEDPKLQNLTGVIADASLIWSATPLTKATFTARTSVYESTDPEVSGVLARDFGVEVNHSFRTWLIATLKLGYGLDDYVGISRLDRRYSAAAALTYKMNRNIQLKGEIRREQRFSDEIDQDYVANIFLLGLRLQH